jgi:hypothetical protein
LNIFTSNIHARTTGDPERFLRADVGNIVLLYDSVSIRVWIRMTWSITAVRTIMPRIFALDSTATQQCIWWR